MMGRRFTWVIVAGVGALLLFAGLDALRSSAGSEDSAPGASTRTTTTTTTTADLSGSLLPCDVEDLRITIDLRGGGPTLVARNFGDTCYRLLRGWRLRIEDRAGDLLAGWDEIQLLGDGIFPAGSESSLLLSRVRVVCKSGDPTSFPSRSVPTSPVAVTSRTLRLAASGSTQRRRGKRSSALATAGRGSSLLSVPGPASIKLSPSASASHAHASATPR
jgi:hypothetical protein